MKTHNNVRTYKADDGTLFLSQEQAIRHDRTSRLWKALKNEGLVTPEGVSLELILAWCADEIDRAATESTEAL